ncbi:MAG: sulfatase-like hydrolase/transferase [Verrucomicrobia bacterium]|nr:sulfatase-like hydrolase/transferase [Verrucomicrobiota bacterium]
MKLKLLLLLVCLVGQLSGVAATKSRPDIVIFLTDDHSQLDLSPYGGTALRTPYMQRLADVGMTFTDAYVASPSCAPSRAALLTGLMPARNGAEANHAKPRAEIKKWPAYFQELGYEVVSFGKVSHYRHTADYGFDYFAHDTFHDHAGIPAAVEFLKNRSRTDAKPLCIFVGSNWPHVPWPETDLGYDPDQLPLPAGSVDTPATRAWRARYAAAVTKADTELGLILDATRAHLGANTLVLFSADHGAQWPFAKWNSYEAGVRVPLIVSWPGVVKPNTRTAAQVSWVDFLPTLLEAAGGKAPRDLDGRSFIRVLQGKRRTHRDRIFTTHTGDGNWNIYPIRAVREGDWKYIRNLHPDSAFTTHIDLPGNLGQRAYFSTWEAAAQTNASSAAIVQRYHARPAEELYNLATDPHEQRNLAADPAQARRLKRLRNELDDWLRAQSDQGSVAGQPRLLGNPKAYGSQALSGNEWRNSDLPRTKQGGRPTPAGNTPNSN